MLGFIMSSQKIRVTQSSLEKKYVISESMLMEDPTYKNFRSVGRMIMERKMSEQEILDLFSQIEQATTAGGKNRTVIGKGADLTTAIANAYKGVADKISKSGPVSGVDVIFDKLTDKLAKASGGQQGAVMSAIKKYRMFAKKHPVMQGAIYAILIALTGLSGAGLGGAAILGGIKMADKLLLGNKVSSSLWSGFVTGALAYGVGQAKDALSGTGGSGAAGGTGAADQVPANNSTPPADNASAPDVTATTTYSAKAGDTLSQIAQSNNTSVEKLMDLNPKITNPDVISAGQEITIPNPGDGSPTYDKGIGTASNTEQGIKSGKYTPNPRVQNSGYINSGNKLSEDSGFIAKIIPMSEIVDESYTSYLHELNEMLSKPVSGGYQLTAAGIGIVFENIIRYQTFLSEAPAAASGPDRSNIPDELRPDMPGAKGTQGKPGFLSKAWSGIKNAGRQFTTKLTAEKLKMNWHVAGKPTDSEQLMAFLEKQGAPSAVVKDVYTQLGLISGAAPGAAATTPGGSSGVTYPSFGTAGQQGGNTAASPSGSTPTPSGGDSGGAASTSGGGSDAASSSDGGSSPPQDKADELDTLRKDAGIAPKTPTVGNQPGYTSGKMTVEPMKFSGTAAGSATKFPAFGTAGQQGGGDMYDLRKNAGLPTATSPKSTPTSTDNAPAAPTSTNLPVPKAGSQIPAIPNSPVPKAGSQVATIPNSPVPKAGSQVPAISNTTKKSSNSTNGSSATNKPNFSNAMPGSQSSGIPGMNMPNPNMYKGMAKMAGQRPTAPTGQPATAQGKLTGPAQQQRIAYGGEKAGARALPAPTQQPPMAGAARGFGAPNPYNNVKMTVGKKK